MTGSIAGRSSVRFIYKVEAERSHCPYNTVLEEIITVSGYLLLTAFTFNVAVAVDAFRYIQRLSPSPRLPGHI